MSEDSNMNLTNYTEELVFRYLDGIMKEYDVCCCPQCRMDTAAYALNQLPPKYVVTVKGQAYTKLAELHQQIEVDILLAVIKGIHVVSERPRHREKD